MDSTNGIDDFRPERPQICDNVDINADTDVKIPKNAPGDPFGGEEYGEVQYRTMKWWYVRSELNAIVADNNTHTSRHCAICMHIQKPRIISPLT